MHSHLCVPVFVSLILGVTGLKVAVDSNRVKKTTPINTLEAVYLDGETPQVAALNEVHNAFPVELYYQFKLTAQQKKNMNATHLKLYPGDFIDFKYVKKIGNDEDLGYTRAMLFDQTTSGLSENVTAGFSEKRHVTSTTYKYELAKSGTTGQTNPYASATYPLKQTATSLVQSAPVLRKAEEAEDAEEAMVKARRSLVSVFGNSSLVRTMLDDLLVGPTLGLLETALVQGPVQMMTSAGIPNAEVIRFAKNSKVVPQVFNTRLEALRKDLSDAGDVTKNKSLYSMVNCFHFEDVVHENGALVFPLNKLLPTYRGQTTEMPFEAYDITQGSALFKHLTIGSEDFVEIFYGVAIHSHYLPPEQGQVNMGHKISIGPSGGTGVPVKITSKNEKGQSAVGAMVFRAIQKFPQDEKWVFTTTACTEDAKKAHTARALELDAIRTKFVCGDSKSPIDALQLLDFAMKVLPCGANYLRPDHVDTLRLDSFMMFAWFHLTAELPPHLWGKVAGHDWNAAISY